MCGWPWEAVPGQSLKKKLYPNSSYPLTRPGYQLSTRKWQACLLPLEYVTVYVWQVKQSQQPLHCEILEAEKGCGGVQKGSGGVLHKAPGIRTLGLGIP